MLKLCAVVAVRWLPEGPRPLPLWRWSGGEKGKVTGKLYTVPLWVHFESHFGVYGPAVGPLWMFFWRSGPVVGPLVPLWVHLGPVVGPRFEFLGQYRSSVPTS
jgi:hypothetical protein